MTTKTITPFAAPGYTMFDNDLLKYVMPQVSGSAWKIICFTIRQTWGWRDDTSPTKRKQWDQISYSQYREHTGIKSDSTIKRALTECLKEGYLLRRPTSKDGQDYEYRLNTSLKIEVGEDTTSTETVEDTSTETVEEKAETPTVSVDTKETIKRKEKERGADFLEMAVGTSEQQRRQI